MADVSLGMPGFLAVGRGTQFAMTKLMTLLEALVLLYLVLWMIIGAVVGVVATVSGIVVLDFMLGLMIGCGLGWLSLAAIGLIAFALERGRAIAGSRASRRRFEARARFR